MERNARGARFLLASLVSNGRLPKAWQREFVAQVT
jgi:hypothetical protein